MCTAQGKYINRKLNFLLMYLPEPFIGTFKVPIPIVTPSSVLKEWPEKLKLLLFLQMNTDSIFLHKYTFAM